MAQSSTFICAGSSLVLASRALTSLRHAQAGAWPPSSALLVSCAHAIRRCHSPLSGGRVESLRRGASGMDAARGVKGHGWPLYAGPRSDDGTREVERSETRMAGAKRFWLLFRRLEKVTRPAGRNQAFRQLAKRHEAKACQPAATISAVTRQQGSHSPPIKKTHIPFGDVRQSVPLARCYLVCMIRSRRISVLIFTRWSSS